MRRMMAAALAGSVHPPSDIRQALGVKEGEPRLKEAREGLGVGYIIPGHDRPT